MFGPSPQGNYVAVRTAWPIQVEKLVGRPVHVGAVEVGRVSDVLASVDLQYVFGFEVGGQGALRHFVPWVAARVDDGVVRLTSVFALLGSTELALYLDNGLRLAGLDGVTVGRSGEIEQRREVRPRAQQPASGW